MRIALCLAGLLISISAVATPPSNECSQQADKCREAYDALDTCLHAPPKPDAKPAEEPPPEPAPVVKKPASSEERPKSKEEQAKDHHRAVVATEKPADKPELCPAERTNAESVCKSSNSVCTRDGSRRQGRARKD
jgi:outer membrane biosynthesis protein TonB